MSKKILSLITAVIISDTLVADMSEARELFNDANCMECHNLPDFTPKKDRVNSFSKLHKSVNACAFNTDAGWFDDETLDVVEYLNRDFYHFKKDLKE